MKKTYMRLTAGLTCVFVLLLSSQGSSAGSAPLPTYSQAAKIYGPLGKAPDGRAVDWSAKAAADLNGDGLEDLVVARWVAPLNQPGFAQPIVILLNDGAGGFIDGTANIISGPIPLFFFVRDIIVEDFNGDGRPDLFFNNHGLEVGPVETWPGEQNRLFLSGPNGKLTDVTAQNLPQLSDFSHGSSAADIDGDGDIDLWVNNLGGGEAASYLMVNDGSGKFTIVADIRSPEGTNGCLPEVMARSSGPYWTAFVDADNDGDPDLYVGPLDNFNFSGVRRMAILLNDGGGCLTLSGENAVPPPGLRDTNDAVVTDINEDGLPDLLLFQREAEEHYIQILISNGDGTFRDESELRLGSQPKQLLGTGFPEFWYRDINGDGRNEILLILFGADFQPETDVTDSYLNLGSGFFTPLPDRFAPVRAGFFPVDVNADGYVDFVDSRFGSNTLGEADLFLTTAIVPPTLVSSMLPSSRSVEVASPATVFATVVNPLSETAKNVSISLRTSIPANLSYQATDPATNQVIGTPNTPMDILAGGVQSFVIVVTPSGSFGATEVAFNFAGTNTSGAATIRGLNTLLFSASISPLPDIVALAATPANDGIVNIPGTNGTGVFAVATVNVGAGSNITASVDTGTAVLPVSVNLCETNPATGQCISAIGPSVTTQINANATPTFGIFVQGGSDVPFNPAVNRIFVRFKDGAGVTRGSTSVAVRTQ